MRRQRDGLAADFVGFRGGRFRDLPGDLFSKQGHDQSCVDPCSCEFRLLGWQPRETSETLHPFEGEFDLPAKAVEGEHIGSGEGVGRQRGEEEDVLCRVETARIGLLAALLGVLQQALLLSLRVFRVLAPEDEAQDQRLQWRCPRRAFVDTHLHLAFLLGLSGERRKQVESCAVRVQQAQRVPAGTHDEVRAGLDHGPQIARSRIVAVAQRDIARRVGEALQVLGTVHIGQLNMIHLPARQVVADMQPPGRAIGTRLADRGSIERPQAVPGPSSGRHFRLFGNQRAHNIAEPRRRLAKPLKQRRVRQAGDLRRLGPGAGLAQRHAAAPIRQRQPQQCLGVPHFPSPREGAARPRRCFQAKTCRQAQPHFPPVIQDVIANRHPNLESRCDSPRPALNLAPMTPTLSPAGRGSAPPLGHHRGGDKL